MKQAPFLLYFFILSYFFLTASSYALNHQITMDQASFSHHLRKNSDIIPMRTGGSSAGLGFLGFIIGPILFIISFIMIFQNERKSSIDFRRINLAATLVHEVNPFVNQQMIENDQQLIHITGNTQTNDFIVDDVSGIGMRNAVKISRTVEVKQFRIVQQNNNNNHSDVEYELIWVTSHQGNVGHHSNDGRRWFVKSKVTTAPNVLIGNYFLNQSQKERLDCNQDIVPTQDHAYNILRQVGAQNQRPEIIGNYIYYAPNGGSHESHGSVRIKYHYCNTGPTSVIAKANKNTFQPFRIDEVDNGGYKDEAQDPKCGCCFLSSCMKACFSPITQIDYIRQEGASYMQIIEEQLAKQSCLKWGIRIGSYLLMVISICIFFSPITTLLGYIPLFGGFLKTAVGLAIFLAALIICIPLWLLAFAISWMIFHPKVGIIFMLVALAVTGVVLYLALWTGQQDSTATTAGINFMMRHW